MKSMKKTKISVFVSVLVLSSAFWFSDDAAAQTATETPELTIADIRVAGNRSITTSQVLSKVRSRLGQMFDSATADEDAKRIAELSGVEYSYYNTAIVDNKIQLTFVVVERNIVRAIVFAGNRKFKTSQLRKKLGFKLADYLDPVKAQAGAKAVAEFYRKKGYAFVTVTLEADKLSEGRVIYRIEEGPRVKIKSVGFAGNKALQSKDLKKIVKTKKKKFVFWTNYYIEEKIAKDVTKLQNTYYERGFLDSKIAPRLKFSDDKSAVRLIYVIDEGAIYAVEKITITGSRHFDEKKLRTELKLQEWKVYNKKKAGADIRRLLKRYREVGFIEAAVEEKRYFTAGNKVNVEYHIIEGGRFRIGRINISGNKQTQDKVIRHILDEYDFQPGDWYNADIARGDGSGYLEKLIRRMAVTEATTITPSGEVPGQKDAQVNITEGRTGLVMLGAGVGSDSGIIGQLVFEQRNFDISDKPKSLSEFIMGEAFKGAGQNLRIALEPGTELSRYSISFTEPYWRDKPISLNLSGSNFERGRESYDEERLKGYIGFEKRCKDHWRKSIGLRAESVDVTSLDTDAPQEIIDDKGKSTIFGVRFGIGRDLRDDRFNPTKGYSFNAGYEQVAGDHTFGILDAVYRHYKTINEDLAERKTVLALKLLGATTIGDAPVFEKFYGGGTGTYGIRGFDYRGVSTRGLQRNVPVPEREDPIGSDWIFLANAEVTIPLASDTFSALFFVDSGTIDSGDYRAAVGTGIQILLPQWFGPVPMRFEIAAPLLKDGEDDTQVFSFSVGRLF
jgi:outer membrane protein insertion porin family